MNKRLTAVEIPRFARDDNYGVVQTALSYACAPIDQNSAIFGVKSPGAGNDSFMREHQHGVLAGSLKNG